MKKFLTLTLIMLTTVGCDLATKQQAAVSLKGQPPISFLGDTFRLQYAENRGAMLGLGDQLPSTIRFYLFTIIIGLLLFSALAYLLIKPFPYTVVLFGALFISGGLGNWYSRTFDGGAVIDFLNMGIGPIRTGIFNVADIAVMIGAIGIFLFMPQDETVQTAEDEIRTP